ncbi:MAG: N-acetyltransferase family protein [Nocardioides sp.]
MSEVSVREVHVDDWATWRDLRLRALQDTPTAFGSTYDREAAFTEADWQSRLHGPAGAAVIAYLDGRPAGMGGGFRDLPGWLHIVAMWTDPAWRGHGAGSAVLEHLKAWSAAAGLRVHLDVETSNQGARRLYERAGFVATGETRPLRQGSSYLVERMVLPIEAVGR